MYKPNIPFVEFPKIARFNREVIVTEKIDGTNAQIYIPEADTCSACQHPRNIHYADGSACSVPDARVCPCPGFQSGQAIYAGSRTKWITPEDDNHGFARWAEKNKDELLKLGPGHHFGEWWGSGIQRGYGLTKGEKRFSLFNVGRWSDDAVRPACCHVVPVLWRGMFEDFLFQAGVSVLTDVLNQLRQHGSVAAPGFKNPEGIVIFHVPSQHLFKKTLLKDESPKGAER